jgi:putative ABC transport system ATP-binding protein
MTLLQELNTMSITILVVTHERDVAEFCEKIVLFRDGQMQGEEKIIHRRRAEPQPVANRGLVNENFRVS